MKTLNFSNRLGILFFLIAITFLSAPEAKAATNTAKPFNLLSGIEGLRFETPIEDPLSIQFLTDLQTPDSDKLLIVRDKNKQFGSILDLLVPQVEAEESTQSAQVLGIQTESAMITDETPLLTEQEEATAPAQVQFEKSEKKLPATQVQNLPLVTPTPLPAEKAEVNQSESTPTSSAPGLSAEKIFALINNYRATKGLALLEKDERACEVARSRAPEIGAEIAGGYMHKGIRERNLPYWNSENIISMRSEEAAVNWWINDYIHRVQIEGDYRYSCVACHGNSCVQEFTNFQSKR